MKHPLPTTMVLLLLFLLAQTIGLLLVAKAIPVSIDDTGAVIVGAPDTALGPPPETDPWHTLLLLAVGVTIGTVLILILAKFKRYNLWRVWFLIAAWMTMTVSFGVLFNGYYTIAALLGLILAVWKSFKPNAIVHNMTELFIYPGIAILFYHILSVPVMLVLMGLISVYDVIAVLHSKHMVSMAKFQTNSRVFAGLAVPRQLLTRTKLKTKHAKTTVSAAKVTAAAKVKVPEPPKGNTAILGGGDIAFPLLFAAVVLEGLVAGGATKIAAFGMSMFIAVGAAIALGFLFFVARKDKFYPAMPAVTVGCLVGWTIILLI